MTLTLANTGSVARRLVLALPCEADRVPVGGLETARGQAPGGALFLAASAAGAAAEKLPPAFADEGCYGMDGDVLYVPHQADHNPADRKIGLSELLRLIPLYNTGAYRVCTGGEGGFCPRL